MKEWSIWPGYPSLSNGYPLGYPSFERSTFGHHSAVKNKWCGVNVRPGLFFIEWHHVHWSLHCWVQEIISSVIWKNLAPSLPCGGHNDSNARSNSGIFWHLKGKRKLLQCFWDISSLHYFWAGDNIFVSCFIVILKQIYFINTLHKFVSIIAMWWTQCHRQ